VTRDYSHDAQSNLLAANDNLSGASGAELGFTYDAENRVETASVTNLFGAGVLNNSFTYSYDAHDRCASLADSFGGNTAYGYDPVDRLTRVTTPQGDNFNTNYDLAGGACFIGFDYAYTDRGNLGAITESGDVTRERACSYDARNVRI
jgi:YD repeat-containing protein